MNSKQRGRATITVLGVILCAGMTGAFSTNAYAICTRPKLVRRASPDTCGGNPRPPHSISGTVYTATVNGTVNPSALTLSADTTLTNETGTLQSVASYSNSTFRVWLPHTYIQAYKYTTNGVNYLQIYVSTKSEYAPNGDSGTFVFNQNGNLVSNNLSDLDRIRGEIQRADPQVVVQVNGIGSWFSSHWEQITSCATFAGGIAAGIGGIVAIAGSGGALAPALIGLGTSLGGAGAIATSETKCF